MPVQNNLLAYTRVTNCTGWDDNKDEDKNGINTLCSDGVDKIFRRYRIYRAIIYNERVRLHFLFIYNKTCIRTLISGIFKHT